MGLGCNAAEIKKNNNAYIHVIHWKKEAFRVEAEATKSGNEKKTAVRERLDTTDRQREERQRRAHGMRVKVGLFRR